MKVHYVIVVLLLLGACSTPPEAIPGSTVTPSNGTTIQLEAGIVEKEVNGATYQLYAYNRQLPGPTLRVTQGTTIKVNFTNNLPEETTIHWHGLRHNYTDDGVPGISQDPVKPGESFLYTLQFPDDGIFWYHPHIREDRQQDLGLYGNILVESPQATRPSTEALLMLDDILIEDDQIVGYGKKQANFALMGRFGNIMLTNFETNYTISVQQGETVRFYITSAANVRPFNVSIENTVLTILGSDLGFYEQPIITDSFIIGPAERYIIEAMFLTPGTFAIKNVNLWQTYELGKIVVRPSDEPITPEETILSPEDIRTYEPYFNASPSYAMILTVELQHGVQEMHSLTNIEWEDSMLDENRETTPEDVRWIIKDEATGQENMNLTYQFQEGDVKKIRIINDNSSKHPMQHLIHFHGQRFLVVDENGIRNTNLVWKDTVFVPTGTTIDIILDASNPGIWMVHCHISEHLEAGMMSTFTVGNYTYRGTRHP